VQIVDANGKVIAEVDSQFATQVLEALPEGAYVPAGGGFGGGGEDELPENYGEPSAAERRYYGEDIEERDEANERHWQEKDMQEFYDNQGE
jgi:hypothetical protein